MLRLAGLGQLKMAMTSSVRLMLALLMIRVRNGVTSELWDSAK
jgi:hypothetical protein